MRHLRRRVVQIAVLVLGVAVPWCDAVRIDMPAARVVYLGRAYPLEWPYVLGLIIPFLVVVWAVAGFGYFWPAWVMAGWGVFLALAVWDVYFRAPISEADVAAEMKRMR